MTQGVCEQLDMLLLVPLVVLLAVAAIALRRVRGACKRCGTIDRRLAGWRRAGRYCATCGWPMWPKTPLIVRGVFAGPAADVCGAFRKQLPGAALGADFDLGALVLHDQGFAGLAEVLPQGFSLIADTLDFSNASGACKRCFRFLEVNQGRAVSAGED